MEPVPLLLSFTMDYFSFDVRTSLKLPLSRVELALPLHDRSQPAFLSLAVIS
jgi:hypothetical protein